MGKCKVYRSIEKPRKDVLSCQGSSNASVGERQIDSHGTLQGPSPFLPPPPSLSTFPLRSPTSLLFLPLITTETTRPKKNPPNTPVKTAYTIVPAMLYAGVSLASRNPSPHPTDQQVLNSTLPIPQRLSRTTRRSNAWC